MARFRAVFSSSDQLNADFGSTNELNTDFGSMQIAGKSNVAVDTTEKWNSDPTYIAKENFVYVYTDHQISSDGSPIPGFKVGDGNSYLIDLPFSTEAKSPTSSIQMRTTEEWDSDPSFIGEAGVIYIYSDHVVTQDGQLISGFKIGDGATFLVDLPFTDAMLMQHINDNVSHITEAERVFWNNKVTAVIDAQNPETLILTNL